MTLPRLLLAFGIATSAASGARAQMTHGQVSVNAMDNIYGAGQSSAPGDGNVPTAIIPVTAGQQCVTFRKIKASLTNDCASAEGCVTLNRRRNLNDPDGVGGQLAESSNTGTSLISGIKAPDEGYLVGVFLPTGGPSGAAPVALNFDKSTGKGTSFGKLSPALDQTFFVGDGKTMDGLGARQHFVVPTGAASLVLGFSDTCDNGNGPPGCYFDNRGRVFVHYELNTNACE